MLWILALPVAAVIALLAYALGYGDGKKVGTEIARREYEAWREMRYCGTALLHMKEAADEIRRHEGKLTMHKLRVVPDVKLPRRIKGTGMDRQFNELAPSLKPAKDGRFKILGIEKNGDELKIITGTGEPPVAHTHFHFRGVKDFDTFIFGGEERRTRPAVNHFHGASLAGYCCKNCF